MKIRIKTPVEIERMRKACRLAAETLRRAGEMVRPGVALDEIDRFVHDFATTSVPSSIRDMVPCFNSPAA